MSAPITTPQEYPVPKPRDNPDFTALQEHLKNGVQRIQENEGYPGKDFEHYVFEIAMEAMYGPDVWNWWNANAEY